MQGIVDDAGSEEEPKEQAAQPGGVPGSHGMLWLLLAASENGPARDPSGDAGSDSGKSADPESPADELDEFNTQLTRFDEMNPSVMVEPFRHEPRTLNLADMQPVHFYVPAVLALLLQHIAVSLAGLSIVSERLAGTTEIMRAAPVRPVETLIGKYLSFLIMLGVVAAALTALAVLILKVPLSGSLSTFTLVAFLLIFVSLGVGFLISGFVRTESQAIQLSMVMLLATIFFSGLFIALYRLSWPAQVISWAMPATYGVKMLQDTMLLGLQPPAWMFWVLGTAGVVLFFFNWLRMRSLMVRH
jgi:ABC-2 type transport system permease protein